MTFDHETMIISGRNDAPDCCFLAGTRLWGPRRPAVRGRPNHPKTGACHIAVRTGGVADVTARSSRVPEQQVCQNFFIEKMPRAAALLPRARRLPAAPTVTR